MPARHIARLVVSSLLVAACFSTEARGEDGGLAFITAQSDGVGGINGLQGPVAMAVSADGANVYTVSTFDDALAVFSRDPLSGTLTYIQAHVDGVGGVDGLDGLGGPRAVTVSPDGKNVYVAAAADDSVAVFFRDVTSGELFFVEAQRDGVDGVEGLNGSWAIDVSPDGKQVYAAGFIDRAVVHFDRDPGVGALSFVDAHVNGTGGIAGLEDP